MKTAVERSFARDPQMLINRAREVERVHGNRLVRDRASVMEANEALQREDDGLSL